MAAQSENKVLGRVGLAISGVTALGLLASSTMKLSQQPEMVDKFTHAFAYPQNVLVPLGFVELLIALIYAIPRTRYWGAILATGYLGGAVATHVRVGEPFVAPLVLGILVWVGLFLRDARFRDLLSATFTNH